VDKDSLGERGRALEDEYFRKKDRELVEKMRRAAEVDQARTRLGQTTGLNDPALLQELQELGFTADTVSLLPLVPVLQMAWAEGGVTREEREVLVRFARSRGIAPDTAADRQLTEWLANRPDEAVFARAGRLIRALLESGSPSAAALTADELVLHAEKIAAASGGILGLGRISPEERALLKQIAQELKGRKG
jgi:tellurite resistance protein